MQLSTPQQNVLLNLDHVAFYGQNIKTFGALMRKGLIEFRPCGELDHGTQANQFRLTKAGKAELRLKLERLNSTAFHKSSQRRY